MELERLFEGRQYTCLFLEYNPGGLQLTYAHNTFKCAPDHPGASIPAPTLPAAIVLASPIVLRLRIPRTVHTVQLDSLQVLSVHDHRGGPRALHRGLGTLDLPRVTRGDRLQRRARAPSKRVGRRRWCRLAERIRHRRRRRRKRVGDWRRRRPGATGLRASARLRPEIVRAGDRGESRRREAVVAPKRSRGATELDGVHATLDQRHRCGAAGCRRRRRAEGVCDRVRGATTAARRCRGSTRWSCRRR